MATTTNYGWTTPDDTALVKDGASAIRSLGSSIDTTTKNLNPETTLGDLAYRSATANVKTRLGIGTNGQVLTVSGGVPVWSSPSDQTPLTTKGDLFTFDTADTRLGVGTNGQYLSADSTTATGLKWATPSGALTLLSTTTLSGNTNITSISGSYNNLVLYIQDPAATADWNMTLQCNQDTSTSNIHLSGGIYGNGQAFNGGQYYYVHGLEDVGNYTGTAFAIRIENYAATNQAKVIRSWGLYRLSAGTFKSFTVSGLYNVKGTAVTSLRLTNSTSGSSFNGGTAYLYGEK